MEPNFDHWKHTLTHKRKRVETQFTCWGTPNGEAVMYEYSNSKLANGSAHKQILNSIPERIQYSNRNVLISDLTVKNLQQQN